MSSVPQNNSPARSRETGEPLIELSDVTFQYRAQAEPTLHNISLRIHAGEKIAVVGPSGSGKSTLLHAINGLIPHLYQGTTTGSIRVCGKDPSTANVVEISERVGTVLQDANNQFVSLTVAEDIAFSLENQEVPTREMGVRVKGAAELAHVDRLLASSPHELSGGQKQRVAVAGVLVDDVDVLLFDEPLANLDPASGRRAIELIHGLNRDLDKTVVIVEHRLEDVLHRNVDRIVLMDHGRIVVDAPPAEVIASNVLHKHGIRAPLHVEALNYAGSPVTATQQPQNVERIELSEIQVNAVHAWAVDGSHVEERGANGSASGEHASGSSDPADRVPGDHAAVGAAAPAVDLRDVHCKLPTGPESFVHAVQGVSMSIAAGEMVGILGSNGAGKSTLARVICGFEKNATGEVLIGGQDASTWTVAARGERVGFVLQEPSQMLSRPLIADEIALGMRARQWNEERIKERTNEVLRICGLYPYRSWPVSALSHGQKKRVTIASVLALDPQVLILDEPTAGQDFAHYTEFMDFLRDVNSRGVTVILITHDMHLALEYTDRVLVMSGGTVIADDDPARVLSDPSITEQADLVTTGLYTLAQRCAVDDPSQVVRRFVEQDRHERATMETAERRA